MDGLLLDDRRLSLLDDEPIFSKSRLGAFVEFSREKSFARSDGVRAVDDDDVIKILHRGRKSDAIPHMDMKLLRRIQEDFGDRREIFLRKLDDAAIDVAEIHLFYTLVAADFACDAAVSAANDEYTLRMRMHHERDMRDHFMVRPLILDGSLENTV